MDRRDAGARPSPIPRSPTPGTRRGVSCRRAAPSAPGRAARHAPEHGRGPARRLVAAAAFAVYLNSLGGALFYDDVMAVLKNPLVHAGDVGGILSRPSWNGGIREQALAPDRDAHPSP